MIGKSFVILFLDLFFKKEELQLMYFLLSVS